MSKAIDVLKALEAEFGEAIKTDEHISGADAVDAIVRIWPQLRAALAEGGPAATPADPAEAAREEKIRQMAISGFHSEGEIEVDQGAVVSEGDDNGAYVQAWVWVSFSDTALDKDAEPDQPAPVVARASAAPKPGGV